MEPQLEKVHQPTGERFWGEHFLFWGASKNQDVAYQMHFARMPFDTRLHRGFIMAFLPDDMVLVVKHVGHARSPEQGPGTDSVWAECIEPFKKWRIRADGVGRVLPRAALNVASLSDGPLVPVQMDVEYSCTTLPWLLQKDAMKSQVWASFHMEQGCAVSGTLSYGTAGDAVSIEHRIDGAGFRDHSVGVRSEGQFRPTTWINGVFPKSGRTFGIVCIGGEAAMTRGFVATADSVREIDITSYPVWTGADCVGERFDLAFDLDGERQTITGELLHAMPGMCAWPNHFILGVDRSLEARLTRDSPARIWWNGEEGYGYDQRTGPWGAW